MDLKLRLAALRAATGQAPLPRTREELGQVPPIGSREAASGLAQARALALARALDAQITSPGVIYREERLGADYRHGGQSLGEVDGIGSEPLGVRIPAGARGWLFFDTETTGLAGGTGTLVFLFGAVQRDAKGFRLRQWLLTGFGGEPALLDAVARSFAECALLVSYNGKSFDLPLLRTRMRMHRRSLDEAHLIHLDLLHPARSAFARRWPDVRLQTAEQRLCAYRRHDDLPGSEAPAAFTAWLRHAECAPLVRVMQHHRDDVLTLVTLCAALTAAYRDPASQGADEDGIVRRLRRRGYRVHAGQGQLALAD